MCLSSAGAASFVQMRQHSGLPGGWRAGLAGAAAAVLFSAWQTAQASTLLWGWVLLPAALAGLAARLYPGLALQLTRAFQAPHPPDSPALPDSAPQTQRTVMRLRNSRVRWRLRHPTLGPCCEPLFGLG